jgi:iron complex transport system ATP-binding protein
MISASNISVKIPTGKLLVDDFSIGIKPNQLTAIIGKNGAGKSTALKAICGDIELENGLVSFDGKESLQIPINELAKQRAIVRQKSNIEFEFSVREVVALGRSPFSGLFTSAKDQVIIKQCLEKVDAYHLIDRIYTTLSGGEQQRVQFARALAQIWDLINQNKPSYLLLDEPLASLDVAHQHEMMHVLKQLCEHNVGVLIILHDLNLAAQYADVVHILKDGKTVAEGSPFDVFTEEIIFDAFDHPVSVVPHPKIHCPLIIASGN